MITPHTPFFNPQSMVNKSLPFIMHIDLNSCFAIIEQQANRLLRGRPVGVAAYDTPRGFVVAASYEAKAKGIKLGVNVEQSRSLAPGIVIMTPDPAKYREAHRLFKAILLEYSPVVIPKSIDEFILDLENSNVLKSTKLQIRNNKQIQNTEQLQISNIKYQISESDRLIHSEAMKQIALDIKKRIAESLGEWVTVNIGISTNRFLAKYAAGFDKPDGMTLIDHTSLRKYYACGKKHDCLKDKKNCKTMHLVDLPGINTRFRSRLRQAGIYTPIEFLEADLQVLKKQVFKSINGYHWYMRLRGYEADAVEFSRKSIGHQHALSDKTSDMDKLERLLIKLCEKTGRRLRKNNFYATGIHLYLGFDMRKDQWTNPQGSHAHTMQGSSEEHREAYALYDERALQRETQQSGASHNGASGSDRRQVVTMSDLGPASFENMPNIRSWHHGEKVFHRLYSTPDIYEAAKRLLYTAEIPNKVKIMSVHVFGLEPWNPEQLSIFDTTVQGDSLYSKNDVDKKKIVTLDTDLRSAGARKRVSDAVDAINNRYGEFVLTPAMMLDMQGTILDRIAFGQVKDLE
jgi:DNA polymerase IV